MTQSATVTSTGTTLAIVGAGRGLGAAVARRFGREGFSIALLSRSAERAGALAQDLEKEGLRARGFAADVRDPDSLDAALERAGQELGRIEVLVYSPLPQKEFLRPVLETTPRDMQGALEFSVHGPLAAAHQVVAGMRSIGKGSILFVNGGSAARPGVAVAGTSVAFAGQTALGQMLHEALEPDGIHVGQLIIPGQILEGHDRKDPAVLADRLWTMHEQRGDFRVYADSMDEE